MSKKKHSVLGMAALAAAGAGVAVLANKSREEKQITEAHVDPNYRNTERGKNEKNSKGIYYTNGNYEAFARPEKPEGVDDKHAYLVGSGLASLAAACFLVRDAQMPGDHIHILEAMDIAGGACDGIFDPMRGYVMRGGREMENHFECLWDLFHSIPSLEKKKELWEYLKGKDKRLYLWMRNGIMGGTMNLPGRGGRKISVEGYKICQKLFGFN